MYKEWCANAYEDWNNYITNGRFMGQGLDNQPSQGTSTTWYIVDVLRHNDKFVVQVAYLFTSATCPVYIRTQTNGTWNAWRLFNPGTANTAQVLSGYTFSSANGVNLSGTMPNRGNLNWSPSSSTSYSVPAGYYSGGTLNSANAYNAGKTAATISATQVSLQTFSSTYGSSQTKTASNLQNAYHLLICVINSGTASISFSGGTQVFDLDRLVTGNGYAYTRVRLVKTSSGASVSCTATSSYQIYGGYFACYRLSLG